MRPRLEKRWLAQFTLAFAEDLRALTGVSPESERGKSVLNAASARFEELLTLLISEFEDEKSYLSRQLADANVDRDFLRGQIVAIGSLARESQRTGRRRWLLSAVFGLGSLFGSVAGGVAEGVASTLTSSQLGTSSDTRDAGLEQLRLCSDLLVATIEEGSDDEFSEQSVVGDKLTPRAHLINQLDSLLAEIDGTLEQSAEEFVRSYVRKGGE